MAKTDNLTDFLTGVANAIRTKKGTTAKINPQNFETEIGSITTSKPEQEKTAALSMSSGNQIISPDDGKVLSKVTITKPTTLMPENIRKDTNIGGVVGTLEEVKPEQEKTTDLSMLNGNQIVSPDSGKVLSKVTITKPTTLTPENIKKNIEIGGVVGTLEEAKPEQEKTANATNSKQIISPDNGKTLSSVIVEAAPLPNMYNTKYRNINKCLIDENNKILILGCDNSIVPSDGSVTSIDEQAFLNCSGLTSVTIPDGVTSIGYSAFDGCSGLTSVTIPNSVTSIGVSAFQNCRNLTSVTIPNGVTSIVNYTFSGCRGLTSVTIPDGVTSIGYYAFENCRGLTSITIPDSVTAIYDEAFEYCSGIESLVVTTGNKKYHSANNCIIETDTKALIVGCKTSVIPSDGSVTRIRQYSFAGCSGLMIITIPDSVTSIGQYAFMNCHGLTSVTIGNGITYIDKSAFSGCDALTSITMLSTTPPRLGSNVIPSNVTTITVPVGCGDAYKTAAGWSDYADKIVEATA